MSHPSHQASLPQSSASVGGRQRAGAPPVSSLGARRRMQATRQRDTRAEVAVRSALHRLGLRYRLDRNLLAGLRRRADIIFSAARIAVFVDGCFWHGCPIHGTWPKANAEWWRSKIEANQRRDADTDEKLAAAGWIVVRVWEHEEPEKAAERIALLVQSRKSVPRQS